MQNLSVIIPIYNEEENVLTLAKEIEDTFRQVKFNWEVIWVDDYSSDSTADYLHSLPAINKRHRIVLLPTRCGQSAAVLNGIQVAKFPLIGTLDGDGQNSPFDLLSLKRLLEETDVYLAQGVRMKRQDAPIRLFSTGLANSFRRFVLKDHFNDVGCAVRVFQKEIISGLPAFSGWHRFFPVMVSYIHPDKVLEHPVSHRERIAGTSKYGVWNRLWVGLFDLVGMLWFKRRKVKIFTSGEVQWKNSSTPSVSLDKYFLPEEFLSNGLLVSEQMNQ